MKLYIKAFTLIEIMIGILIVSLVMIGGFQALSAVTIGKARLIQQTDIQKESFYFTEKLFETIKNGGTIDYEEYFNRKVIGNITYLSGHFDIESGFGNFGRNGNVGNVVTIPDDYGEEFYYCRSNDGDKMLGIGCVVDYNSGSIDYTGEPQRYGQYSFQFIDYNSNYDDDGGDEDGNGEIRWDDDDEYLGNGPIVFSGGVDLTELYLISGNKKERTLFRWNVRQDPDAGSNICSIDSNTNIITGSGCIGTIEYLKLEGKDWGLNHDLSGNTYSDGIIDTWIIDSNFTGIDGIIAGAGDINRVPLFPDTINVTEFKVFGYPNMDIKHAWKNTEEEVNISPYIILKLKLKPSWKSRKKIQLEGKELDFSMTINLSEIYSN